MTKNQIRCYFKNKRSKFSPRQVDFLSKSISVNFFDSITELEGKNVCSFLPKMDSNEVNTYILLEDLISRKGNLVLTKTDFNSKKIRLHKTENIHDTQLNQFGIPEPVRNNEIKLNEISICVIPLLGFDTKGGRVGYGGGYYDRLLSKTNTIKVGVSLFDYPVVIDDQSLYDIPMDYIITPFETYCFFDKN